MHCETRVHLTFKRHMIKYKTACDPIAIDTADTFKFRGVARIGRAAVSKTAGCRFESGRPCKVVCNPWQI